MTLDELLRTIEGSTVADWHKMNVQTIYGWSSSWRDKQSYLVPKSHDQLAVYKPDVDVSIAFDATVVDPFQEPWVQAFPDPHAVSIALWFRYRGAVVYERVGVVVDGARYLLPMPRPANPGYQVQQTDMPLARLLFELYGVGGAHDTLYSALARAGVAIV